MTQDGHQLLDIGDTALRDRIGGILPGLLGDLAEPGQDRGAPPA
ncbi:hypothetical protein ABT033_21405 [Streptomyces pharetrae]